MVDKRLSVTEMLHVDLFNQSINWQDPWEVVVLHCGLVADLLARILVRRQIQQALHVFPSTASLNRERGKLHRKKTTDPSVMRTENFVAGIVGCRGYFRRRKEQSAISLTLCKRKRADRGMQPELG
jgi:hypothetical protein